MINQINIKPQGRYDVCHLIQHVNVRERKQRRTWKPY
jgi:hypothetical protein